MGNFIAYKLPPADATAKVVLPDGTVLEFSEPTAAAELMLQHSNHVVVELSESVIAGKRALPRPPALPADTMLEQHKVYVMLPVKRGKPVGLLSPEARRAILRANHFLRSGYSSSWTSRCLPPLARACCVAAGVEVEKMERVKERQEIMGSNYSGDEAGGFVLDEGLEFEYCCRRELSRKGWKPSLDTIEEKLLETKLPHWLF